MKFTTELYKIPNDLIKETDQLIKHCESKEGKLLAEDIKALITLLQRNNTIISLVTQRNEIKNLGNSIKQRIAQLEINSESSYNDARHLANFFETLHLMYGKKEYKNTIFHSDNLTIKLPAIGSRTANLKEITLSYYELVNRRIDNSDYTLKVQTLIEETTSSTSYPEKEKTSSHSNNTIERQDSLLEPKGDTEEPNEVIPCKNNKKDFANKIIELFSAFDLSDLIDKSEKRKSIPKQNRFFSEAQTSSISLKLASKLPTLKPLELDQDFTKPTAFETQCVKQIDNGNEELNKLMEGNLELSFPENKSLDIQQSQSREASEDSSNEESFNSWEMPNSLFYGLLISVIGIPVLIVYYICKAIAPFFCATDDEQHLAPNC